MSSEVGVHDFAKYRSVEPGEQEGFHADWVFDPSSMLIVVLMGAIAVFAWLTNLRFFRKLYR